MIRIHSKEIFIKFNTHRAIRPRKYLENRNLENLENRKENFIFKLYAFKFFIVFVCFIGPENKNFANYE